MQIVSYHRRRIIVDGVLISVMIGTAICAEMMKSGAFVHEEEILRHLIAAIGHWITDCTGAEIVVTVLMRIGGAIE